MVHPLVCSLNQHGDRHFPCISLFLEAQRCLTWHVEVLCKIAWAPKNMGLVKKQAAELEGLRRRREEVELASPKTPELTLETIAEFKAKDKLTS